MPRRLRRTRRRPSRPARRQLRQPPDQRTDYHRRGPLRHAARRCRLAFGKLNPYQYGVLPVLVVIQNDSDKAIRLDRLKVEYVGPNRDRVEATPAKDVRYLQAAAAAQRDRAVRRAKSKCSRPRRIRWTRGRSKAARCPRRCSRPDNPPAASSISRRACSRRHPLPERALRSGHRQRDLLLRTSPAAVNRCGTDDREASSVNALQRKRWSAPPLNVLIVSNAPAGELSPPIFATTAASPSAIGEGAGAH